MMLSPVFTVEQRKQQMESIGIMVLNDIQENIDPAAIIAGGWARDLLIKEALSPKDIDVWMFSPKTVEQVAAVLNALYPDGCRKAALVAQPGTVAYGYARAIFKFNIHGADVDFILVHAPVTAKAIVERFDFNVCQAAFNGSSYIVTDAFERAVVNRRLELTEAAYERPDLGRIVHYRLPHLRTKFADWSVGDVPEVAPAPPSAGKVGFSAVYFE